MRMRILLTGATGLIGRETIRPLLDQGHHVIALSRSADVAGASEVLIADILDNRARQAAVARAKATHLIHLAWHDDPKSRWNAPQNLDWAAATLQLVREFADAGGQRAVCVGSCSEYDLTHTPLNESAPLQPQSLYGKAKAATGTLLCDAAPDLGLSLLWARIFFCYGPGEPRGRLLGDLLHGLTSGERVPCSDGTQERDFLHTGDIGRALGEVLLGDLEGYVNVASGIGTPVRDLINITAGLMTRPDLIDFGALAQTPGTPARIIADITRLKTTGFKPAFDLGPGLADCVTRFTTAKDRS